MMITIHGLPPPTKYADLKVLIKQKCNITDFILDSLMSDGADGTKKVRVGLADDSEGSHLMKCLDGYRLSGYALRVVPVAKSSQANHSQQNTYNDNYQQSNDYHQPNQMPERSRQAEAPRPAAWVNQPGNQWQANQSTQPSAQNTYNYQQQQQPTYGHNVNQPIKPQFEQREVMQPSHRAQPNQAYSHSYSQKSNLISLGPQRNAPSNVARDVPEAASRPMQGGRFAAQQNYDMPDKPPQRNAPSNVARDVPEAASRPMQGGRFAAQQNYDMPDKPPLRSLPSAGREGPEAGARPTPGGRFPAQQNYNMPDKPLTIMKDNFQGPTQYNLAGREPAPELAPYAPTAQAPWASQHQPKPFEKPIPTYEKKPYDDRKYPPIAQIKDDLPKPDPFKGYDRPREFSPRRQERGYPPRRDISPERAPPSGIQVPHSGRISPGRRVSPSRRISPGRRISPERQVYMDRRSPGRRISPHGRQGFPDNRRASPGRVIVSDRRISPSGRHIQVTEMAPSPPHRRISPPRKEVYVRGRISPPTHTPADRRMRHPSPGAERDDARRLPHARRESPRRQAMRYSPTRHHGDKPMPMDYQDNRPNVKNVRPAYEPPTQASNEAKYSGGFRPNVREDVHYPVRGQERWPEKEFAHKDPEDRRDTIRLQKFDIPRDSEQEPMRSGNRLSRSPRRDRSPLNRVRRHSPSPRSPRRSWALEKRRSPEIREPPPPPIWPGQDNKNPNYQHPGRPNFPERDHEKTSPVWQSSSNKKIINDEFIRQRNADREHFEEEMRRRQADVKWKPVPQMSPKGTSSRYIDDDRALRDDKFARKGFEERRDYREDHELSGRRDRDDSRYKPDFEMKDDIPSKKQVYPARIEERKKEILKKQEQLQKEIDEVYKRAVDFTKKAELYRKGELKKDSSFEPRRRDEDSSDSEASYEGYSRKDRKDYEGSRHESSERITKSTPQKSKRDTAIEQIADKLMSSHGSHLPNDLKSRVVAKLQLSVSNILKKMFGNQDVSFIEMVIKFNSHHTVEDEERIFDAVMSDFPAQFRRPKKPAKDDSDVPAKSSRRSDDPNLNAGGQPRASEQNWNVMPSLVNTPIGMAQVSHQGIMMNAPVMVPMPAQYHFVPAQGYNESLEQAVTEETKKDGHSLYLCKDDFQTIEDFETVELKDFLVKQLIKETQMSHGWAPDFTLAKQNSSYRHEVITRDERSRDWLLNLDFSEFQLFNVLVYTTEELWYERAAIWLPGHSRYRNIDPLTKLKLQNKRLEGINIGKWKFVKKIVNEKGTRVYVDMPPSAARALEKHNMLLTYELQKVNVFLKAVAIDKEAFDAGLNERSIDYLPSPNLTPMPSIPGNDNDIIQIAFKGNKPLTLPIARKVKDTIIYKMYKYHQLDGKSKTDFVKYGFCQPGYFCILPENSESRKWLRDLDLGKINRTPLIILGEDDIKNKYFNMSLVLPFEMKPKLACERIKQSNRGVKGINFSLWKNHKVERNRQNYILNVDMDLESIETIAKMKYKLDLVIENREYTVDAESNLPRAKLEETIAKYKAELSDKYDVANMDLASDTDDDIICLD